VPLHLAAPVRVSLGLQRRGRHPGLLVGLLDVERVMRSDASPPLARLSRRLSATFQAIQGERRTLIIGWTTPHRKERPHGASTCSTGCSTRQHYWLFPLVACSAVAGLPDLSSRIRFSMTTSHLGEVDSQLPRPVVYKLIYERSPTRRAVFGAGGGRLPAAAAAIVVVVDPLNDSAGRRRRRMTLHVGETGRADSSPSSSSSSAAAAAALVRSS
jgi:hypothetical protein